MKLYQINTLKCISSTSDDKGLYNIEISLASLFYQTKIILFVGSSRNSNYNYTEKKLNLYDLDKQTKVDSQTFDSEILSIKVLNKIIFVTTKEKMTIFNIVEENNVKRMKFIDSIKFQTNLLGLFDICKCNKNDNKNLIAVENQLGSVEIFVLFHDSLTLNPLSIINPGYKNLQKIIMTQNFLFIVEEQGVYIKCYCSNDFQLISELYRGKKTSNITNIIEIDGACKHEDNTKDTKDNKNNRDNKKIVDNDKDNHIKYIAVSSSNGTIHIYSIVQLSKQDKQNESKISISNFLNSSYKYLVGDQIKSIIKINLRELCTNDLEYRNTICNCSNSNEIV